MAKVENTPEFKKFFSNLEKMTKPDVVLKTMRGSTQGENLINVVIGQARAGLGPMQSQYAPYSKKYGQQKDKAGQKGMPYWLRGVGNTGRAGGMLDPNNFGYEMQGSKLFLVWRPKVDSKTANYAAVHNDGNATTPMRKWMHVRSVPAARAVLDLFLLTYKKLATRIKAGEKL